MSEGLRERKVRETRRRIELAAVNLAYEGGIAHATVERICAFAQISRSSFFNYFPTREQAIFGAPLEYDPQLTERLLSEHSDDLVVAASLIVSESVRGDINDEVTLRRLALFVREPGTTNAVSWSSHESRERLIAVIAEWLDTHRECARLTQSESAVEARMVVAMAIAVGDEAMREMTDVDGRVVLDLEAYRLARRRLAMVLAMPASATPTDA